MSGLPEGFKCECGEFHKYPAYMYAHWRDVLTFECPKCKTSYSIICGSAKKVTSKKRSK